MNVMNFIKKSKNDGVDKMGDRFGLDRDNSEYQKVINRQGSKKLIQGSHMMHHHGGLGHLSSNHASN